MVGAHHVSTRRDSGPLSDYAFRMSVRTIRLIAILTMLPFATEARQCGAPVTRPPIATPRAPPALPVPITPAAPPADPCGCASPFLGTLCRDGSVYAGLTPGGNKPMYTTYCQGSATWNGSSYTGGTTSSIWATNATVLAGTSRTITGKANTAVLAAANNADSPYPATLVRTLPAVLF